MLSWNESGIVITSTSAQDEAASQLSKAYPKLERSFASQVLVGELNETHWAGFWDRRPGNLGPPKIIRLPEEYSVHNGDGSVFENFMRTAQDSVRTARSRVFIPTVNAGAVISERQDPNPMLQVFIAHKSHPKHPGKAGTRLDSYMV